MSIVRFDSERGRWRFDGRKGGKRIQKFWPSDQKAAADEFKRRFDAEKEGFVGIRQVIEAVKSTKVEQPNVTVDQAIDRYREVVMPKKAQATREVEIKFLDEFYQYLYDRKVYYLEDLSLQHLEAYQTHLAKSLSEATVNRKFNAIKHFVRKCFDWKMIEENVGERVQRLSEDSKEYEIWTEDDFRLISQSVPPDMADFLWGLLITGLRPGQLGGLTYGDLDFENCSYETKTKKGGKWRKMELPAPPQFFALVTRRREKARFQGRDGAASLVFTTRAGKPVTHYAVNHAVKKARVKLGIEKRLCPYGLRHTFGTNLNKVGANLRAIAALLGHAQVTTSVRYTRNVDATLRALIDTSPTTRMADRSLVTKPGD